MLDTVKINHVQHISFTQSRLTDAVSVILSELLSYEHPSKSAGLFCPSEVRRCVPFAALQLHSVSRRYPVSTCFTDTFAQKRSEYGE